MYDFKKLRSQYSRKHRQTSILGLGYDHKVHTLLSGNHQQSEATGITYEFPAVFFLSHSVLVNRYYEEHQEF